MAVIAVTEIRHGHEEDGGNVVDVFAPGDEVTGVPDEVLLQYVDAGAVLLVGKDKELSKMTAPQEEPPIYGAHDPRYLQQQRDERAAADKAQQERLKAFRSGRIEQFGQDPVDQNLPKSGEPKHQPASAGAKTGS